jgi:plasmid maintenance system antidote protein VapI
MSKEKPASKPNGWIEARLTAVKAKKKDLAAAISVSPTRITEIIAGKRKVKAAEVAALARVLKLSDADFLTQLNGGTESEAPPPDADAAAFKLVDLVASIRPLTSDERYALYRAIAPEVAALVKR